MKIPASPRVQKSVRERRSTFATELKELIDNSLGLDRGNATAVHLYWDSARELTVADNGRGMEKLSLLFGLGLGSSGTSADIGRYGQGGTAALLWLSDVVELWTVRRGLRAYTRQDLHQIVDVASEWPDVDDTEWEMATTSNVPEELAQFTSGTMIRMHIRDKKTLSVPTVLRELERVYTLALRHDRYIIWHDADGDMALRPWQGQLSTEDHQIHVRGLPVLVRAGIDESISQLNAGLSVCFGFREILFTREPFGDYSGGKVYGWIELGPGWHDQLTNDKTDLTDDRLKAELFAATSVCLAPLLDLLREAEDTAFMAEVKLAVELHIGPVMARLFPDTSEWSKIKKRSHKKKPHIKDEIRPREVHHSGLPIKLIPDSNLDGRYMSVTIHEGTSVTIRYDKHATAIKEAQRQHRARNSVHLRSMISDEFAAELVRKNLTVRAGLFGEDRWQALMEQFGNDTAMLASFTKPKIFDVIREIGAS